MDSSRFGLSQRRLRINNHIRELSRDVHLGADQFIQPYFVNEGQAQAQSIPGLTGVYRETPESLLKHVEEDLEKGARKLLLFGVPAHKKSHEFDASFTASQIQSLKKRFGHDLFVSVDVCFCSHTTHGHCGILKDTLGGAEMDHIDNGATVKELAQTALVYAQAGADCVAPSDMMDGRIAAIRESLDRNGYEHTLLMSYAAKFHSKFYGPFRLAADSAPKGGTSLKDRATYQIDPANRRDAIESARRDALEGADILMVKPGLPYLDVLSQLSASIAKPWAVYEVSGEYAAIELMANQGLISGPEAHVESWIAFARAGASMIISYGARHARQWLTQAGY